MLFVSFDFIHSYPWKYLGKYILSLVTFTLPLDCPVLLCRQSHLCVFSHCLVDTKPHICMNTVSVCYCRYSQNNNTAQGRKERCSLVSVWLEVKCSQSRIRLGSIGLSALSHRYPPAMDFVIMSSSFSADYTTGDSFCSDSFCLCYF